MEGKIEKLLVLVLISLLSVYFYLYFVESSFMLSSYPLFPIKSTNTATLEARQPNNLTSLKGSISENQSYYNTLDLDYFHAKDFLREPRPDNELKSPKELLRAKIIRAERVYLESIAERNWFIMSHPKAKNKHPVGELENIFKPAFKCPHEMEQLGVVDDDSVGTQGNWVCGFNIFRTEPKPKECVVYTFGLSSKSEFEKEWTNKTDCTVFKYRGNKDNVKNVVSIKRLEVQPEKTISGDNTTLRRIMDENDHGWLELLALDIQNTTYAILDQIMEDYKIQILPFAQLIVKFPLSQSQDKFSRAFAALESVGMRPFHATLVSNETNNEMIEYSFFNLRGKHLLLVGSED